MDGDRRKFKRHLNYMRRVCGFGKYVETCDYHPAIVVRTFFSIRPGTWSDDIQCRSLIDGRMLSCSLTSCGVVPLTKDVAERRAEVAKALGIDTLIDSLYGSQEGRP